MQLPDCLARQIVSFLDLKSHSAVARACKALHVIATSATAWPPLLDLTRISTASVPAAFKALANARFVELQLPDMKDVNIDPLPALSAPLASLSINNAVAVLAKLNCSRVRELTVRADFKDTTCATIAASCPNLEALTIRDCRGEVNVSGLKRLGLRSLTAPGPQLKFGAQPHAWFSTLQSLSRTLALSSIPKLAHFTALTSLSLDFQRHEDAAKLFAAVVDEHSALKTLTTLQLSNVFHAPPDFLFSLRELPLTSLSLKSVRVLDPSEEQMVFLSEWVPTLTNLQLIHCEMAYPAVVQILKYQTLVC